MLQYNKPIEDLRDRVQDVTEPWYRKFAVEVEVAQPALDLDSQGPWNEEMKQRRDQ